MKPDILNFRRLDIFLFSALIAVLIAKALLDLDVGWDNLNYHLPFAAMRSGIFGNEFRFTGGLTAYYDGFPPLHDFIKGYLWKLTGYMNTVNLLTVVVFFLFVTILHYFTGVPLIILACAIAAIPTIHTQLAGGHVDNLSNLSFSVALIATFIAATQVGRDALLLYCVAIGGLVFAANVKLQFVVLSSLAFLPISGFFFAKYAQYEPWRSMRFYFLIFTLGALAIGWLPLRSLILFDNPIYPISLDIFSWQLPGTIKISGYSDPAYLASYPQFIKWLVSVSEYQAFGFRSALYTIAQGDVPRTAMSFRMGGYLFLYVFVSLILFVYLTWLQPRPRAYWILAVALAITAFIAMLPSSHELRYFSFWMVTLVSSVLTMLWANPDLGQLRFAYTAVCVGCFLFVASGTGYFSLIPYGFNLDWIDQQIKFSEKVAPRIHANETYCAVGFGKYILALEPKFHPELGPYRVLVAQDPRECGHLPILAPQ